MCHVEVDMVSNSVVVMPMPGCMGFAQGRGGNRYRLSQNSNSKVCYLCKEKGHFVAACPNARK